MHMKGVYIYTKSQEIILLYILRNVFWNGIKLNVNKTIDLKLYLQYASAASKV